MSFLTAASAANCKAIEMLQSVVDVPRRYRGCAFGLGAGATLGQQGTQSTPTLPVFSDGAATGLAPVAAYSSGFSVAYPIASGCSSQPEYLDLPMEAEPAGWLHRRGLHGEHDACPAATTATITSSAPRIGQCQPPAPTAAVTCGQLLTYVAEAGAGG